MRRANELDETQIPASPIEGGAAHPREAHSREVRSSSSLSSFGCRRTSHSGQNERANELDETQIRTSLVWLVEALVASGAGSDGHCFQCPSYRDATPSLSLTAGRVGVVLFCHAGCPVEAVLAALGLRLRNLYVPPPMAAAEWLAFAGVHIDYPPLVLAPAGTDPTERLEAVHDYGPDYRLERWRSSSGAKRLLWFRRDPAGCWIPGLGGIPTLSLPLYREPDVRICAATGEPLYIVESESSVDALNRAGHYGTTWAGGASTPPLAKLATALADVSDVRVVADHDESGIRCAQAILTAVPHATGWIPPTQGHDVRDVLMLDPALAKLLVYPTPQEGAAR